MTILSKDNGFYPLKPIKNDKFDQLDTFTKTMKFYYLT